MSAPSCLSLRVVFCDGFARHLAGTCRAFFGPTMSSVYRPVTFFCSAVYTCKTFISSDFVRFSIES